MQIVDRRLNPKAKSLGNRQRFMRRAKAEIRAAARAAISRRKVGELEGGERISIPAKGLSEPSFGLGRGSGARDFVVPGNEDFSVGDNIQKPPSGGGGGSKAGDGEGNDEFVFTLTKDEFLDLFFEDLKLPNLVKAQLKVVRAHEYARAGIATEGSPAKLNRGRTMRNSLARRVALSRPTRAAIERLEAELEAAEAETPPDAARIADLKAKLKRVKHLRTSIAYIDPIDLRFNRHEKRPRPTTQAVMFCLMDVSASMTEPLKDIAKRFFMLLNVFLTRHYRDVEVVFIRHTTEAQEVDEETFFSATTTGGTVVSTALEEMQRIIAERYPQGDWNIYAAQASDGHNVTEDMDRCLELLEGSLLPSCQYFAYIEVDTSNSPFSGRSVVWAGYQPLVEHADRFAMRRVTDPGDIYPVFRELFAADRAEA
jgi:uncharacterized sporulation protein YeaH/YhbH (DUF444 family)